MVPFEERKKKKKIESYKENTITNSRSGSKERFRQPSMIYNSHKSTIQHRSRDKFLSFYINVNHEEEKISRQDTY